MAVIYEKHTPIKLHRLAEVLIEVILEKLGENPKEFNVYEVGDYKVVLRVAEFVLELSRMYIFYPFRMQITYTQENNKPKVWNSPLKDELYIIGEDGYAKHHKLKDVISNPEKSIFLIRKENLEGSAINLSKLRKIIGKVEALIIRVIEENEEKIYLICKGMPIKAPFVNTL